MKNQKNLNRSGFTLIELIVVIGILAVLFAIVLVAINPSRQFKSANDTKRRSDVNAILNAVYQYSADNKGVLPAGIGVAATAVSTAGTLQPFCDALVPTYIAALPTDPTTGTAFVSCAAGYTTGYSILQTGGRVTVTAVAETPAAVISVTR
jgi:prepilin-type N-terminal cleavage/methylation domain-containing protein